jgi:hypothetical protein
MKAHK